MKTMISWRKLVAALALSLLTLGSTTVSAHGYYGYGGPHHYHGGGNWWGPALGVGLVLGSAAVIANAYAPPPRPVVVVPGPVMATPQASSVWYFCADSNSYYPQVQNCPSGWRVVPAAPPPGY